MMYIIVPHYHVLEHPWYSRAKIITVSTVLLLQLVIVGQHAVQPGGIGTGINEPVPGEVVSA